MMDSTSKEYMIEELLQDYDPKVSGKTYAQLAAEHSDKAGLKVLASRDAESIASSTKESKYE